MRQADRRAERLVDLAHTLALRSQDPVAALRREQTAAEEIYARTGHPDDLALVRAFARSLDREETP